MVGLRVFVAAVVAAPAAAASVRFEAGPGCADVARFGGLLTQEGWDLALGPSGPGWRLELTRGPRSALLRTLPEVSSCEALAQAATLIIERYFREVAAGKVAPPL